MVKNIFLLSLTDLKDCFKSNNRIMHGVIIVYESVR